MATPTALITGGTSGIGRSTAGLLHARRYQVAMTGQNPGIITQARNELPADVVVLRADARPLADTDHMVEEVHTRFGTFTTLFLNAGITLRTLVESVDEATYHVSSAQTRDSLPDCYRLGHFLFIRLLRP